jgi:hypothetical protein
MAFRPESMSTNRATPMITLTIGPFGTTTGAAMLATRNQNRTDSRPLKTVRTLDVPGLVLTR